MGWFLKVRPGFLIRSMNIQTFIVIIIFTRIECSESGLLCGTFLYYFILLLYIHYDYIILLYNFILLLLYAEMLL